MENTKEQNAQARDNIWETCQWVRWTRASLGGRAAEMVARARVRYVHARRVGMQDHQVTEPGRVALSLVRPRVVTEPAVVVGLQSRRAQDTAA